MNNTKPEPARQIHAAGGEESRLRRIFGPGAPLIVTFVVPLVLLALMLGAAGWFADRVRRLQLIAFRDASLVVLELCGILLLLVLGVILLAWLCAPVEMTLGELENSTTHAEYDPAVLTKSLTGELHRIKAVHAVQQEIPRRDVSLPPLVLSRRDRVADSVVVPTAPSNLVKTLGEIGTVELAGASLPLGQVLVAMKRAWPLRRSGPVITGRLSEHGPWVRLAVRIRQTRKHSVEFSAVRSAVDLPQGFAGVVRDAAARIAYELSPGLRKISWQGFAYLTDALEEYQEFVPTRNQKYLDAAREYALQIPDRDHEVKDVRALLYNLGVSYLEIRHLERAEGLLVLVWRSGPTDAIACNALGVSYFEQRRLEEAEEMFRTATKLRGSDLSGTDSFEAHPWNGLGNTYVELGEYPDAIKSYSEAIELQPEAPYPHNGLGNAYLQQDQWADAEREYRTAIALDERYSYPWHGIAARYSWHGLGNVCARQGEYKQALQCHRTALALDSSFANAWNGVGDAQAHLGRPEEAIAAHKKAIELRDDDPYSWRSLGDTYLFQGRLEEALEAFERAAKLDSQAAFVQQSLGDAFREKALLNKSDEDLFKDLLDQAESAYSRAVDLNPKDARSWDGLARVARDRGEGNLEAEIGHLTKAAEANPDEPFSWNQLGDAYYRAGRFRDAIYAHQRALNLDMANSFALDGIGKARLELGHLRAARKCHEKARQTNDRDEYASYGIAAVLIAKYDYSGALAENLNAVRVNANMPYVWNGVGDSYERLRQYEKASASYQKALRLDPGDAYSKNGQARIALAKGDLAAALEATLAAIALNRSSDYAFITLGDIQTRQSAYNDAVEAYRQAIMRTP